MGIGRLERQIKRIDTPDKLERILECVVRDLVGAHVFLKLYYDINASFVEYKKEVNNSGTFWFLTRKSLYESALLRICRAYDEQKDANGLRVVLLCIQRNPQFFDLDLFRVRNPNYSIPDNSDRMVNHPEPDQLQIDLKFVAADGGAVRRLKRMRHEDFVHSNIDLIASGKRIDVEHLPTYGDLDELLEKGLEIGNRYLRLFRGGTWSAQMVGEDDYKIILNALRESSIAHEKQLELDLRKYR